MPILEVEHISKSFNKTPVLKDVGFNLEKGQAVSIIGSSGSGKTTLLRCLNFLEHPDNGIIRVNGETLFDASVPATTQESVIRKKRLHFGLVFQNFNLFPQYTALENVMLAKKLLAAEQPDFKERKREILTAIEVQAKVLLTQMGLDNRMDNYPHQLSGGQCQRVAIARALVNEPKVLLLDEPLGALDLKLRKDMQIELKRIQQSLEITFIYVTHDQEEALTMSDTVVVMNNGDIQQIGSPVDIYNEPKNAFVADFIGESNILNGMMVKDLLVEINGHRFECVDTGFGENKPVDVVIRPEDIQLVKPDDSHISGVVQSVTFKGVHYEMLIEAYDHDWLVHSTKAAEVGSTVGIKFDPYDIHIMHKMND